MSAIKRDLDELYVAEAELLAKRHFGCPIANLNAEQQAFCYQEAVEEVHRLLTAFDQDGIRELLDKLLPTECPRCQYDLVV